MMRIIRDVDLWFLIKDSKEKRMILWVDEKYHDETVLLLKNVDVNIEYAIIDRTGNADLTKLTLEDKDSIMIIVARDDYADAKNRLESMGFTVGIHFKNIRKYTYESFNAPYYYDPICGYNLYTGDSRYNGFKVFGDPDDKNALRIVTLGSSTSDAYLYQYKSWSEFMHEELSRMGICNVVFCGAVSGYTSAEELFKLIRDGLQLNPEIVLNYSGSNDIKLGDNPYINSYMRRVGNFLKQHGDKVGTRFDANPFGITWGIDYKLNEENDNYSFWFKNQKMMHAICQAFGIKHISIHNATLCNGKKNISRDEEEYMSNICYCGVQKQSLKENIEQSICFKERALLDIKEEWLEDVSTLFDYEDVYWDRLHVKEAGNEMIANEIINLLKKRNWINVLQQNV